jgi:uncharacterized membrane protein YkvA (DUF1232 family)
MSAPLIGAAVVVGAYLALVLVLLVLGRRRDARALAGFVPDAAVLLTRLVRDRCVPRRRAWLLAALAAYLASPIDIVPDFIPVLGYLDDVVILAVALRLALRDCREQDLRARWPGPDSSLAVMLRLAGA